MDRKAFLAATAAAATAVAVPNVARSQTRAKLRVAIIPSDFAAQPLYAKELGMFERAGLDVEISQISNGAAILSGIASGALDIGYCNAVAVSVAHEKGLPFTYIAPAIVHNADDDVTGLLAVGTTSTIRSAKDLEGKTIAVSGINELATITIKHYLDVNGADLSKVRFVEMPFAPMPSAIAAGRVDAASLNRTTAPTAGRPGDPLRILANTYNSVAPRWATSAYAATPAWVAAHPMEARAFAKAMREAAVWGNAHHKESAAILAKATDQEPGRIEMVGRVPYITSLTPALIQPIVDLSAKYGLIKATFPASEIIDPIAR